MAADTIGKEFKNIFIVCDSAIILDKLRNSLQFLRGRMEAVHRFRNIDDALDKVDGFISSNEGIDLIVSDVAFQSSDTNIIALINKLENYKSFWNTPVLIFTNVKNSELLSNVSKAFVHLPNRIVFTENSNENISRIFQELIEFKVNNQKYLELEVRVNSIMEMANRNLLKPTLMSIESAHKNNPEVCTIPKTELLIGELYYSFWKSSNKEMNKLAKKLDEVNLDSPEYQQIIERLEKETEINKSMVAMAKSALRKSVEARPSYWKANEALYRLHMDLDELTESKQYLEKLISLFPAEATYCLKMGKLNDLSNHFSDAVESFLNSTEMAVNAGVSNLKNEDLMEIVDASLQTSKKIMKQLNVTELTAVNENMAEYESEFMLKSLRKSNAQLRVTLERMSREFPSDPFYLNKIAITYRRTGEYHIAEGFYEKAIQADPNDPIIKINYAMCLACNNLFDQATNMIESISQSEMNTEEKEIYEKSRELINKKDIQSIRKVMV